MIGYTLFQLYALIGYALFQLYADVLIIIILFFVWIEIGKHENHKKKTRVNNYRMIYL